MSTTATMPNLDLGSEIEKRRRDLQTLEHLNRQRQELDQQIAVIIQPTRDNGRTVAMIRKVSHRGRRANGRKLGDIVHEHMVKTNTPQLSVAEAMEIAKAGGYQSKSDNFISVVRQMLEGDKRFRKHKLRGQRAVVYALHV